MPFTGERVNDLSGNIAKLLAEKQHHTDALNRIDSTLQQISALLGVGVSAPKRRGRPPKAQSAAKPKAAAPTPPLKGKRRWFEKTAEQSILDFLGKSNGQTAKEINAHWKQEGRGGKADNALSLMVKAGKLKRSQIEGKVRGSAYAVA